MAVRVFVAGGTGVVGRRLVPRLVARGHQVTATTTSPEKVGRLERLGATTLYTTETRELFGRNIEVPITGLSATTQNIILLRHIEHRATMLRVMGILKVRDDAYDGRMRELQITDSGLVLLDTFAAESRVATGGGFWSDLRTTDSKG